MHTGKGHEFYVCLSGRLDYTFLPYTKYEGRCTEHLIHVMMKVRKSFEPELNVYMLI